MLSIDIPGGANLRLEHLVLDFNGTLARDGELLPGLRDLLLDVPAGLLLHIVTGDTYGLAERELAEIPCRLTILPPIKQTAAKLDYVEKLGADSVVSMGNGRNDRLMMAVSGLAIAVVGAEGLAVPALEAADILARDIFEAFELLAYPQRIVATMRQ